jgi:hypothetical protein
MGDGARRARISNASYQTGKAAADSVSYQTSYGAVCEMVMVNMPPRSGEGAHKQKARNPGFNSYQWHSLTT